MRACSTSRHGVPHASSTATSCRSAAQQAGKQPGACLFVMVNRRLGEQREMLVIGLDSTVHSGCRLRRGWWTIAVGGGGSLDASF